MVSASKRKAIVDRIDNVLSGIGSEPVKKKELGFQKKKKTAKIAPKKKSKQKFKMAEIRKVSKTHPKDAKAYLNLALEDIHEEEERLRHRREEINNFVASTEMRMTRTRSEEDKLRDELSNLVSKESRINAQKTKLKNELAKVDDKILRVKKIDDDLKAAAME